MCYFWPYLMAIEKTDLAKIYVSVKPSLKASFLNQRVSPFCAREAAQCERQQRDPLIGKPRTV